LCFIQKVQFSKITKILSENLTIFIVLSIINTFGFLAAFIQLSITKPNSKKVLIPIVFCTSAAFLILIAIDFFLEIQLTHISPKESYTQSTAQDGKSPAGKKGKARFKMGYLIIYGELKFVRFL
jgi:hypothetical protein